MPPFPPTITKKESHLAQTLGNKRPNLVRNVYISCLNSLNKS